MEDSWVETDVDVDVEEAWADAEEWMRMAAVA